MKESSIVKVVETLISPKKEARKMNLSSAYRCAKQVASIVSSFFLTNNIMFKSSIPCHSVHVNHMRICFLKVGFVQFVDLV